MGEFADQLPERKPKKKNRFMRLIAWICNPFHNSMPNTYLDQVPYVEPFDELRDLSACILRIPNRRDPITGELSYDPEDDDQNLRLHPHFYRGRDNSPSHWLIAPQDDIQADMRHRNVQSQDLALRSPSKHAPKRKPEAAYDRSITVRTSITVREETQSPDYDAPQTNKSRIIRHIKTEKNKDLPRALRVVPHPLCIVPGLLTNESLELHQQRYSNDSYHLIDRIPDHPALGNLGVPDLHTTASGHRGRKATAKQVQLSGLRTCHRDTATKYRRSSLRTMPEDEARSQAARNDLRLRQARKDHRLYGKPCSQHMYTDYEAGQFISNRDAAWKHQLGRGHLLHSQPEMVSVANKDDMVVPQSQSRNVSFVRNMLTFDAIEHNLTKLQRPVPRNVTSVEEMMEEIIEAGREFESE